MRLPLALLLAAGGVIANSSAVGAYTRLEHWRLADSLARRSVSWQADRAPEAGSGCLSPAELRQLLDSTFQGVSFAGLCSLSVKPGFPADRRHAWHKTVLGELKELDGRELERSTEIENVSSRGVHARSPGRNVVACYLCFHLAALHRSTSSVAPGAGRLENLRSALAYEAIAQGYLADAFSSGRILVPHSGALDYPFKAFHPWLAEERGNHFSYEGVFVINSRGETWRTFGEGLLEWYTLPYWKVYEAAATSMKEILIAYQVTDGCQTLPAGLSSWVDSVRGPMGRDQLVESWTTPRPAHEYYSVAQWPSLMLVPMPVAATWSVRTRAEGYDHFTRRKHFPQLADAPHDSDRVHVAEEYLFRSEDYPEWMLLPASTMASASSRHARTDSVTSVQFVQERNPATLVGPCGVFGVGTVLGEGAQLDVGLGWGLSDIELMRSGICAHLLHQSGSGESVAQLVVDVVFKHALALPQVGDLGLLLEVGMGLGMNFRHHEFGTVLGLGAESGAFVLPGTLANVRLQFKLQGYSRSRYRMSPSASVVLH